MLNHSSKIIKGFVIGSFKYRKITSILLLFSYLVYLVLLLSYFKDSSSNFFKALPLSVFIGLLIALLGLFNILKNLFFNILISLVNTYFFFILFSTYLIYTR